MSLLANLRAELARKEIAELNYSKIATDMNMDLRTFKSRMEGLTDFTSEEMSRIRDIIGADKNGNKFTIEYLFFNDFENECLDTKGVQDAKTPE